MQIAGIAAASVLLPLNVAFAQFEGLVNVLVNGGNGFPWERIELPGTKCGNGSQYKFFVYDNPSSNDLLVMFEGGGACWDYESCSGQTGVLGAANPNGIDNNYINELKAQFVSPLVNGADPGLPFRPRNPIVTNGWDVVYMPYCTGDTHVGNNVKTYTDPTGTNPPLVWHHSGFNNTRAAANYLASRFTPVNRLMVTGFSAGGVATGVGYYEMRSTIQPNKGFSLNDSGPLFPAPNASYKSYALHQTIKTSWDLPSLYSELPPGFNPSDFGSATSVLATAFPNDQHAYTGYSSDYNFSRFSYERFFPGISKDTILSYWRADQANLINKMNQHSNFSYHIPWHRPINDSHCSTIITFIGSHACKNIRKKRWYEYFVEPWQSWKCTSGFTPIENFLDRWVGGEVIRIAEKQNNFNNEDAGMAIVAPLIDLAL